MCAEGFLFLRTYKSICVISIRQQRQEFSLVPKIHASWLQCVPCHMMLSIQKQAEAAQSPTTAKIDLKKKSAVLHQCGSLHLCSLGSDTRLQRDTGNKWLSSTADGFFLGTSASKKHFIWIDLPLCESDSCKDAIRVSHIAILTRMLCVGPKDSRTWLILCFFLSCYVLELWLRV